MMSRKGLSHFHLNAGSSVRTRRGAFTLIEVLISLAILSLLMALLIPAMSRARESARLAGCLSNLHQIMIATLSYTDENNDQFPFPKPNSLDYLDNYGFGGRYTTSNKKILASIQLPQNRPLNRFLYPQQFARNTHYSRRELGDPNKFNIPLFECPSDDSFNYTERSRDQKPIPAYTQSAYFTTGSSYAFNASWMGTTQLFRYSDIADWYSWNQGMKMFSRAKSAYPSRFVAYLDEPANFLSAFRVRPEIPHHTESDAYSLAFLDAHAALVTIKKNNPFNPKHTMLFPEQANGSEVP